MRMGPNIIEQFRGGRTDGEPWGDEDLKSNTASLGWVCQVQYVFQLSTPYPRPPLLPLLVGFLSSLPLIGRNQSSSVSLDWVFLEASVTYFHRLEGLFCISSLRFRDGKEQRRKERESKRQSDEKSDRRASKESHRSSEGGWRTPLSSIWGETIDNPMRRPHVCPLSKQLLGCSRPRPMHEGDEGQFISLCHVIHSLTCL